MNREAGLILAVCASLVAGALPVAVSYQLSKWQTRHAEEARLLAYARDVLHRSERASVQVFGGIQQLIDARGKGDPCSASQIALMGQLDLVGNDIQAMAYIANGRLMCSSYGHHGVGMALEKDAPLKSSDGTTLRARTKLPFGQDMTFIVVEREGYAAIVHEAITIDIATDPPNISLATYSPRSKTFRSTRGPMKSEWAEAPLANGEGTFDDGEYLVAVVTSKRYATKTIAAQPLSNLNGTFTAEAKVLWLFGAVAGIALALLTFMVARRQMGMAALLGRALKKRELFLLYQPIVDLHTRKCIGAEALIRWQRSDGQWVPPDVFIPVAEESGLIQDITARVLEIVATDLADVFARQPNFHIGINLAAADLQSPRTVELLATLMRTTKAGPRNILVEATERGLMDAERVRQVIKDIHALGIEVAIDDFGTGYSSLSYLGTFDLDYLKIDKSFVDTLQTDAATSHVALHIIEMAKALNLKMIAEGVETEAQATLLQDRGVQFAQGWLFAKPMRMADLRKFVEAQAKG
ncbi:MAG: EAL domain-containing protein [Rhodoferax sp.]|nr:EAL domain-containing protein [Rhodoferax sp.]